MREQNLEYDPIYLLYGGSISFVVHIVIYRLLSPAISKSTTEGYSTLQQSQKDDWNNRVMSNFNALVSILLSGYCLFYDHGLHEDKVWSDSRVARLACAVVVGYMVADLVCMLLWYSLKISDFLGYICHHFATIYAYYFISAYGVLCFFGMLRLIAEVSTPFVNQRWYFDTAKYPRTNTIVFLNAILMLFTFFLFRMVIMPFYWYHILLVTGTEEILKLGHIQLIMYIPCAVLDALNIHWFYKMCRGFIKALKGLRSHQS